MTKNALKVVMGRVSADMEMLREFIGDSHTHEADRVAFTEEYNCLKEFITEAEKLVSNVKVVK